MEKDIKREFNEIGEKITVTVQLSYEDLEVTRFPESCYKCPVGFMSNNCGRPKVLSIEGRPESCKLKLVDIQEIQNER